MAYDTHMWCRHNATQKHKDTLKFYPCVVLPASVVLGVSGFINLPSIAEMIFMIYNVTE